MYVGFTDIQCQILVFHTDSKCRTKISVALPPILLREVVVKQGFAFELTNKYKYKYKKMLQMQWKDIYLQIKVLAKCKMQCREQSPSETVVSNV